MKLGGTSMAFFLSKEAREERARRVELDKQFRENEKERLRKEEEDRKQKELMKQKEYCIWYSKETQKFIDEVHSKNFNPTWGYEVEQDYDTQQGQGGKRHGNIFVFDIPSIEGLAFDMDSKQMLYFSSGSGYYEKYKDQNCHMQYKYVLIPFSDIFNASVEVNSQTTVSTTTSKQNVIGRSIVGGLIAGDAGAIIGGTTGKNNSVSKSVELPKKIVFNIQTTYPDYPVISFEFNKPILAKTSVPSDKTMADTMYGIFSGEKELATFFEWNQTRQCNTSIDYHYNRVHGVPEHDENNEQEYMPVLEYIMPIPNLETILKRVNKYTMQIESIIKRCNKQNTVSNAQPNDSNVIQELQKLAEMKEKGIISDEEFTKLKAKLI